MFVYVCEIGMTLSTAWDLVDSGYSINVYFSFHVEHKNIFDRASRWEDENKQQKSLWKYHILNLVMSGGSG